MTFAPYTTNITSDKILNYDVSILAITKEPKSDNHITQGNQLPHQARDDDLTRVKYTTRSKNRKCKHWFIFVWVRVVTASIHIHMRKIDNSQRYIHISEEQNQTKPFVVDGIQQTLTDVGLPVHHRSHRLTSRDDHAHTTCQQTADYRLFWTLL